MMNGFQGYEWFATGVISLIMWAFMLGVTWAKFTTKLDTLVVKHDKDIAELMTYHDKDMNGLGARVKIVEDDCSSKDGRMDSIEKSLTEYRRDAQETTRGLAKLEKGMDDMHESITSGHIVIGSQLHSIELMIQEKDTRTRERLMRVETFTQIELKLGSIPLET